MSYYATDFALATPPALPAWQGGCFGPEV